MRRKIENFMAEEAAKGTFPGAVLAIVNEKKRLYLQSFGWSQLIPKQREMREETIFDLASLTKVVATTTAVMQLIDQGKINLWDYLKEYFPSLPNDKERMTIFHLLTHTSGFQAIVRLWEQDLSREEKIDYILNLPLENEIGKVVNYSDPNFILLGELITKVTGQGLDAYTREHIFQPLGMKKTGFNPQQSIAGIDETSFAATEHCQWRDKIIVGEVHDENAAAFGGVSGHAGLFSTARDLSRFVQMLLNEGSYEGERILSPSSVRLMRQNWTKGKGEQRGLGWDLRDNFRSSGGVLLSPESFGHTGFTGTSIWIDPVRKIGIILLSNRVHPSRENVKIISLRPRLHNLIAASLDNE